MPIDDKEGRSIKKNIPTLFCCIVGMFLYLFISGSAAISAPQASGSTL